ncbi:MAG: magnesium chelatase ATPase subunit D [Candidatus Baltobacteraceae bacterium]|jgi:magnesium chelatase subunit D
MAPAKRALLLLAVDPTLGGAIFSGGPGCGKTTLARAFAALLPDGAPFVDLPVGITDDRLIGGLDLEAALAAGVRRIERGLLARADGGVVYVDGLNLQDRHVITILAEALSTGSVRLEREGASARHEARFTLLGTYDPSDGEAPGTLLDRVAFAVACPSCAEAGPRAEVMRAAGQAGDPLEIAMYRGLVEDARERLPGVTIDDDAMETLSRTALELGVEGNRADVFAVKAALAAAALGGRDSVMRDDVLEAARLVLLPRATRAPQLPEEPEEAQPQAPPDGDDGGDESRAEAPAENEGEATPEDPGDGSGSFDETVLAAVACELPPELLDPAFRTARAKSRGGSRGVQENSRRGRFVGSKPGSIREGRLALAQTLFAAAPWQALRVPGRNAGTPVAIEPDDVRVKRFRDKAGTAFIFAVDASGSMAVNRMREAKGAISSLLASAYVHRDQVGLISFRGTSAKVLLEPCQSVDRAKRELDVLPTGGTTPLSSALLEVFRIARRVRARGVKNVMLVLMGDGRGNVNLEGEVVARSATELREALDQEQMRLAQLLRADGVDSLVIDTQSNHLSRGEASELAGHLGARYLSLPNATADQIVRNI